MTNLAIDLPWAQPKTPWGMNVIRISPGFLGSGNSRRKCSEHVVTLRTQKEKLCGFEIPEPLKPVAEVIRKSKKILDFEDDWDGEGSPAYAKATWERAVTFLLRNVIAFWHECDECVAVPSISHGPEGSIDIYWNTQEMTLLINIPPGTGGATYYGKKSSGSTVGGNLDTSERSLWLLQWLTK